jgi:hypothetical protein
LQLAIRGDEELDTLIKVRPLASQQQQQQGTSAGVQSLFQHEAAFSATQLLFVNTCNYSFAAAAALAGP